VALRFTVLPAQMVGEGEPLSATVGSAITVTGMLLTAEQPPGPLALTVYVVLFVGFTLTELVVAPRPAQANEV
jgi:hypothetical protein